MPSARPAPPPGSQHPGIVALYEAAVDDDGVYLVSELVRGTTLGRQLEAGRLSDRDLLQIGARLAMRWRMHMPAA